MSCGEVTSPVNKYGSDGKLNFLCSLDLFPTPLIKNCPNATKKWLSVHQNVSEIRNIGINSNYDELEHASTKVDFNAVSMSDVTENTLSSINFPVITSCSNPSRSQYSSQINTSRSQDRHTCDYSELDDKNQCMHTFSDAYLQPKSMFIIPSISKASENIVVQCNVKDSSPDQEEVENNLQFIVHDKNSIGNLISVPFNVLHFDREKKIDIESQTKDLQDLVMEEIVDQEINQTIFAKATIGKTQGYLSELLRNSKVLESSNHKEYRRARHNLNKIRQFLKKSNFERKRLYTLFSSTKKNSISSSNGQRAKRTFLSADVKTHLLEYYKKHGGKVCNMDLKLLSSHLSLDFQNVKIFYKNLKQRTKILSL